MLLINEICGTITAFVVMNIVLGGMGGTAESDNAACCDARYRSDGEVSLHVVCYSRAPC